MLFVLTGVIQTGKTRWLLQLVDELAKRGVVSCGVIAPGVWADRRNEDATSEHVDVNGFEKLGIDNVLLPAGKRIQFARRTDLAVREGSFDAASQSAKAQLSWHISEDALQQVNCYLTDLAKQEEALQFRHGLPGCTPAGLLVIDELGRLELLSGGGLTGALALLDDGPTPAFPHALIVVRKALLDHLEGRFEKWGERKLIGPDSASTSLVLDAFSDELKEASGCQR